MDVDDTSRQSSEEGPSFLNVRNRKFVEKVHHCAITLDSPNARALLRPINAILNSGGGIVLVKIDDFSRYERGDRNKRIDTLWQTLEHLLNPMIQPSTYDDVFDRKFEGDTILLFIKATDHFCTVDYNIHLPNDATLLPRPPHNKVFDLLSCRDCSLENHTPEVPLTDLPMDLLPKKFTYKEVLNFHESKQVQFKSSTSNNRLFHPNNQKAQNKIRAHISSFGNGSGGMILIGIEDKTGEILGQDITADGKAEWESKFQAMISKMSKTWSFTPKQGCHWDIKFFPVDGTDSSFVIVILVAGMKNLGGIFTKCPNSFELQTRPGSHKEEEIVALGFEQWKERMLHSACGPESKRVKELREKFETLSLSSKGPLLIIHSSVEEIQKDFFPVDSGCPVSPKGFVSNLPVAAQQVIRQIQEQNSRGRERALLVASPSMLSSIKRDENHTKVDGVICDLLLFNKELGGLHLFTLVNSGLKDQFLRYSHATAKAMKESLVMNGGCYEKFYITCYVVPCDRVGTEPLEKLSPDSRYPKEYELQSSLGKNFKILRSLATIFAQFPSFHPNIYKEGLTFRNLLTKKQFQLLYETIDEHRELWIDGPAGSGKTVVAIEFIKKLLRRDDLNVDPRNILYVCENLGILEKVRKLIKCDCLTRKAFMKDKIDFSFTKHVILDEVQNFGDEDGDWLGKARSLVRQYANDSDSDYDSGYLWCFLDKNQTDIPPNFPPGPSFYLTRVIRTPTEIFNYAKKLIREEAPGRVGIGHDLDAEKVTILRYPDGKRIDCLIEVLTKLIREGYSKGEIAVLFGEQQSPQQDHCSALSKHFGSIVDAKGNDHDSIVLSNFKKYSGLYRPVVIAVDIIASLTEYSLPNAALYCVATRAMVKLVFLTEKRGEKRRKDEAGNLPDNIRRSRIR